MALADGPGSRGLGTRVRTTTRWLGSETGRLHVQVFLAGAAVMALEMLAGRLLAPRFGSSVYTWGALIGVVMAALAAGYYLGGRLGDRFPRQGTLGALLLGAASFAVLLPLFAPPALAVIADTVPDPRWGPLLATVVLIAPPALVLGAVTPVAVRLTADSLERTGTAAGAMSGLSTTGSIVGTFATVFVLIPLFEVPAILVATGVALGIASLLTAGARGPRALVLAVVLVGSQAGQVALEPQLEDLATGFEGQVLYHASTQYHELFVLEDDDPAFASPIRSLVLGDLRHGAVFVDDPYRSYLDYVNFFHLGPLIHGNATKVLFVGGGAMTGPKQFLRDYPAADITVVEVDPEVADVAHRFFALPQDPRLEVVVEDGRRYLERSQEQWDVVVLDAYGRNYVPFHLMTVEFLQLVRDRLAPGGIVVSNLVGSLEGETSKLLRAEVKTMEAVFPWVREAPTATTATPTLVQEVMVVASVGTPFGWPGARERAVAWQEDGRRDLVRLVDATTDLQLPTDDVPLLTDDHAPVETFLSPITRASYALAE